MNAFEKIKIFLKNMGKNKSRLLEIKKNTDEEVSSNKVKNDFINNLRLDARYSSDIDFEEFSSSKLDDKTIKTDFYELFLNNIGADKELIKNPKIQELIKTDIDQKLFNQSIRIPEDNSGYTKEKVEEILTALKPSKYISSEERKERRKIELKENDSEKIEYYDIYSSKEDGSVILGITEINKNINSVFHNHYNEKRYFPDGKGNIIVQSEFSKFDENNNEVLINDFKDTYNSDGIAIESEIIYVEGDKVEKVELKRDKENPLIVEEKIIKNNEEKEVKYKIVNPEDIDNLKEFYKNKYYNKNEFVKKEHANNYYELSKRDIEGLLKKHISLLNSDRRSMLMKSGIQKLANKAGILTKEFEQEHEI